MNDRLEMLFHEALARPREERTAFLSEACAGDDRLYRDVEALIEDADRADAVFGAAIGRLAGTFAPMVGTRVGPYKLLRCVGEGGMGVVFLASREEGDFEQQAAIKFVQGGQEMIARFRQERRILARLNHPSIARLIDGGVTEYGVPYMVMEFFPGEPITSYCEKRGLNAEEKLKLFREVCDAVEYAHRSLIVHRDLKPSNILVNESGELKLLDFGIAKIIENEPDAQALTSTGMHCFTPDYASPEQVRGEPVTTATDIYSLGAVLFELLSARRLHALTQYTPAEITEVVCSRESPPLGLGNELDQIVAMAIRKEPERRYRSAAQLSDDISRFLECRPVAAKADSAVYRARKFARRNRFAVAAGAFAILSLIVGMSTTAWQARVARQEAEQAQRRFTQVRRLARSVVFDLDVKLRELPGATEARSLLVRTALEYLDSLYADAATDTSLRRELAAAYEAVGDVQGEPSRPNLGQPGAAIRSYQRAKALWDGMQEPVTFDPLAITRLQVKLAELELSRVLLDQALDLSRRSLAAMPDDAKAHALAIRVERAYGTSFNNRQDHDSALAHLNKALQLAEEMQRRTPGTLADDSVATVLLSIADASLRRGDAELALRSIDRMEAIRERMLAAQPGDLAQLRPLFRGHLLRGLALGNPEFFHLGRTAEALKSFDVARRIAMNMLEKDAKNALARTDMADVQRLAAITLTQNDPEQAKKLLLKALEEDLTLVRGAPKAISFLQMAGRSHGYLGVAQRALGETDEAVRNLSEAVRIARHVASERPKQPGLRHNLIAWLTRLGETHLDVNNTAAATAAIEEALAITQTVPRDGAYRMKMPAIASCYAAVGRLRTVTKSSEAHAWYAKSLALWEELAASGISPGYIRERKRPVELALAQLERRSAR